MLENVLAAYVDAVGEREFDAPFLALLRGLGYENVHFVHGSVEFGKDVIARKRRLWPPRLARLLGPVSGFLPLTDRPSQYAFQLKAGDMSLRQWLDAKTQIEQIRTNPLSHPDYDPKLPRVAVLATTGRLSGQAALDSQQYANHVRGGALEFELWDRERLLEFLAGAPHAGIAETASAELLALLSAIDLHRSGDREIEKYSRTWIPASGTLEGLHRSVIEASLIANRCKVAEQIDLACSAAVGLLRAASAASHEHRSPPAAAEDARQAALILFQFYASELLATCETVTNPDSLIAGHLDEFAMYLTYPVRTLRLLEVLALLSLCPEAPTEVRDASAGFVANQVVAQPGAAHPISDRWAIALAPVVLATARNHRDRAVELLRRTTTWTCDAYDKAMGVGAGLASSDSDPEEEQVRLLARAFNLRGLQRRGDSYLQTVLLDLACVIEAGEVYEDIRNDFKAVDATASLIEFDDVVAQYGVGEDGLFFTPNAAYPDSFAPEDGWKVAPHHRTPSNLRLLERSRPWDHLAISTLLRDRHSAQVLRAIATS